MTGNSRTEKAFDSKSVFKSREGRQLILDQYDKILGEFDFEYKEQYVETSYGSTYTIESGAQDLPPLFLFHGSTSNSASWFADITELNRYFRVIAVDLIGDAGHSAETRLDMKSDSYAQWINEIFERSGIQKARSSLFYRSNSYINKTCICSLKSVNC